MLTTLATVLAGLLGAALIAMGAMALAKPQNATGFGIPDTPVDDPAFRSWLHVKGAREIVCGVFMFVLMLTAPTSVLGWYLLTFAVMPVADTVIVLRSGGPKATAYGVHAATAAVMVATAIALLL
ncbi:DUF4267 domain-containing protein [Streptomyces sp. NBC_01264]|uniref:DUF4267 domain-containing protein n=1 Tax=Streptomyces sp. NBC_01264 TaxID=2903804 RepID=UPI00224FD786|nr:DUF4267 domain-containing protein [Streptomyces sp. NBC_01264]MCX4780719.1 DUF4267 domain-containing protein [Streptomyces sp. NBC_01264]